MYLTAAGTNKQNPKKGAWRGELTIYEHIYTHHINKKPEEC